jgi:PAS domain S-box-containing protein
LKENSDKKNLTPVTYFENLPDDIKSFIELSDDLIFQLDLSGKIKSINKNGARLLDYKPAELIDKYFFELFKPSFRNNVLNVFKHAINENENKIFEAGVLGKYKDEFSFKFRIKSITIDGEINGLIGIGKNHSAIRRLEEKITELNENLKETKRIINIERSR